MSYSWKSTISSSIYLLNRLERIIRVYKKGTSIARSRSYSEKEAKEVG